MKKITFIFAAAVLFTACNSSQGGETTKIAAAHQDTTIKKDFSKVVFASDKDTSCNMPLSMGVEDTLHVGDKVYGFCSSECKNAFVAKLNK